MRRPEVLIGIDQGTTGTAVVAFDAKLVPCARAYRHLPARHPRPGWVEQSPKAVIVTVVEAVAEVLRDIGGAERVVAAGLANQGESIVAWDARTGRALSPVIVWSDERGREVAERLAGHAPEIQARTGLRLDPYFSAAKITWLVENDLGVARAAEAGTLRCGTLDTWLGWWLGGGQHLTDHSTAARTQLMDLARGAWDAELVEWFRTPSDALPAIRPTLGDWGWLAHPSWDGKLPWRASLVDQPAALAGHGCFGVGETKATYGTGCFVLVNAGSTPPPVPEGLIASVAWSAADRQVYAFDGGVFTAGTAIRWLQQVGLIADAAETGPLAASVPDSGGVRFLPAITGLGAPWWTPAARGAFDGITSGTTRAHLVRAVLDAVAFRVRDILEAAGQAGVVQAGVLRADGGMTANGYLMQRQADILGVPIACASDSEATARGAAALAGITAGVLSESDVQASAGTGRHFEPRIPVEWRDTEYAAWVRWLEDSLARRGE